MKELSIKEKAKAYDEAIERANNHRNHDGLTLEQYETIDIIFPELKESKDEKIKKRIIHALHGDVLELSEIKEAVDWLEKQGEQKPAEWHREDEQNLNACLGYIPDEFLRRWLTDIIHVKYDKPVDKIEPKFNVGDWIVDEKGVVKQILSYKHGVYKHTCGYSARMFEDKWRMWDITKDAKDGDVLAVEPIEEYSSSFVAIYKKQNEEDFDSYCFVGFDGKFYKNEHGHSTKNIHPATKEQSDLLFQKMQGAGYKWDADKRELKKIEQKDSTDRFFPSDEQMLAINTAINVLGKGTLNGKCLIELHEQLKKLK